ncbi:MAG: hypothetical protein AAF467_26940 [Actinomycetota bacterium]
MGTDDQSPSVAELLRGYIASIGDLDDWDYFCEMHEWWADCDSRVEGDAEPLVVPSWMHDRTPNLSAFLGGARRTMVVIDGEARWLLAHPLNGGERITALVAPAVEPSGELWAEHAALLSVFGGFVECGTEGAALANMAEALTLTVAAVDMQPALHRFAEYGDRQEPLPPVAATLYPLAVEANGSFVLCDRRSGAVYVATHDPDGELEPASGVNGLYISPRWPSFAAWVDATIPPM